MNEKGKTILLVDDDVLIAMAEARMLEHQGFSVILAHCGEEAVDAVKDNAEIDLILMDIDLGSGMDGAEAAEIILKYRDIPVVFLSAHTEKEVVEKTEKITSYGYVVKNSGETVLLTSIKMAFKLHEARMLSQKLHAEVAHAYEQLTMTNEKLKQTIDEQEATNEELQAAMEELESSNEELIRSQEEILKREQVIDFERKQLLAIFEAQSILVYVSDIDTYEILFINKSLREVLGKDVLHGKCFKEFHDLDAPCNFCTNEILRNNPDRPYHWEFFNKKLNRHYALTDMLINWPDGRKVRLEVARDITELKDSEEALEKYHERLRRAEIVSKSGNWEFHLKTKKFFASEGARAIYGIGEAEWSIPEVQKIPLPEYRPLLDDALAGLVNEGKPYEVEFKIKRPDNGEIVDIHSIAEYDPERKVVFGVIQDITERKRNEHAIVERERMMRELVNASFEAIYLLKPDGTIEITNEIGAGRIGLRTDEARGKNIFEFFEHAARQLRHTMLQKVVVERSPIRFVDRLNGRLFENSLYPIIDDNGLVSYVSVFAADVTERMRIENELEKSEEKYRAIVEHASEAIVIAYETHIVYANPQTRELLGYDADIIYSRPFIEFIHPDDREMVYNNYARRIKGEPAPSMYEFRIINSAGEMRYVEIHPVVLKWNDGVATLNLLTDITERKQLEERLASQRQFLENLIEAIPYPVFYQDAEGRFLGCNRAFAQFLGVEPHDIIGKTVFDIAPQELAEVYHEADMMLFQKPGIQRYESQARNRDGELRFVVFHKSTFSAPDGSLGGIIGTMIDIHEQKKAEEKLLYATQMSDINRERAEKLMEEKELLLKEVHHRIKNNLSTISGLLSLQAQLMKESSAQAVLNDARNRVQSMVILYDRLYTQQYFKSMPLSVYIDSLVHGIVSLYPTGNNVRILLDVEPIELPANKMMPLGILVNELVTNSMKYAFNRRENGIIQVSAIEKGDNIMLTVADDGPGLPAEALEGSSRGFGLELVGLLVKQLKGNMRIETGKGAKFIIEFMKK